jgi:hypothetical protein
VVGRQARRCTLLLDYPKEKIDYYKLKQRSDSVQNSLGRGCGPVVRQTTE